MVFFQDKKMLFAQKRTIFVYEKEEEDLPLLHKKKVFSFWKRRILFLEETHSCPSPNVYGSSGWGAIFVQVAPCMHWTEPSKSEWALFLPLQLPLGHKHLMLLLLSSCPPPCAPCSS